MPPILSDRRPELQVLAVREARRRIGAMGPPNGVDSNPALIGPESWNVRKWACVGAFKQCARHGLALRGATRPVLNPLPTMAI